MAEAVYDSPGCAIPYKVTAAVDGGQVVQLPDGRAGITPSDVEAGKLAGYATEGIFEVAKTTSMVMLPGSRLYWDASANKAHLLHGNDKDFYLGVCVADAASAATTVRVDLNQQPQPTLSFAHGVQSLIVNTAGFPWVSGHGDTVSMALQVAAEAQKVDAMTLRGISRDAKGIAHFLCCINLNSDNAAGDINIGLANGTHASDFESVTEFVGIHTDGNSLNINAQSRDGTTTVTVTDTTVDAVVGTPFLMQLDFRNNEDIQMYIDGVNVLPSSVFKTNAATGPLKLIAHMEKSSDDSPGNITVGAYATTFDAGTVV